MANSSMFLKHHGAAKSAHGAGNLRLARHHVGKMLHALNERTAPEQEGGEAIEPVAMPQPTGLRAKLASMKPTLAPTMGGL